MLLLGHRGARFYAPENSLEAFELALAHGCDGFEFDVRGTADGQPVICHDSRLCGLDVSRSSLHQLQQRCAKVVTLHQVVERFSARAYLYVELKAGGAEQAVLAALAAHPPQRGYVLASFLPEVLEGVHCLDAAVPLGFILADRRRLTAWQALPVSFVMPHRRLLTATLVSDLHAAGKRVFVWTVNRPKQMAHAAALGVDAVLSDDTQLLARTLRQAQT